MSKTHVVTEEEPEKLGQIYYTPEHLWIGRKAIKLLAKESGLPKKLVIHWPKRIDYPHFTITTPNEMHQFDLFYMPHDKLYGNTYKYILIGIDVASRYKVARPLRTKKASEVADMIKDIYKAGPLHYPKTSQCDNGSEFKSDVTKLLEVLKLGGQPQSITIHSRLSWSLTTRYLRKGYSNIRMPRNYLWVKHLYTIVKGLNNTKTAMIGMKPNKAIKLDDVPLAKSEE
ncbi:uncharacterized protein LOC130621266 [Hydractinia symbiolongicarpus]|uniref:uncharacterized protein LOC130621266 n=1 Tax=Hydractinia symbiolongicarpus TaxID=13093 RepID=UPI00254E515C|nr:uncharacterized protein LOC130621266 [Hydractinia symbiolongicarpus]